MWFSSGFSCLGLNAHLHSVITSFSTEFENCSIFIFSKTFSASSLAHSKGICVFWKSLSRLTYMLVSFTLLPVALSEYT